jgi:hypothetical protein
MFKLKTPKFELEVDIAQILKALILLILMLG